MDVFNLVDEDITQRKQIVELLELTISQQWPFSYITTVGKRVSTNPVHGASINADDGVFSVRSESISTQSSSNASTLFRAQSGGLSILFQSRKVEGAEDKSATQSETTHTFELPYKVSCAQLRKAVRANLDALPDVPVILYQTNGALITGTLTDISTTGAKFKISEDIGVIVRNPKLVDACKITFTDDLELQLGIQIVGVIDEAISNVTYLRCEFIKMSNEDEMALDNFIQGT